MRIVLMRHGKPDVSGFDSIQAKDFSRWIEHYNSVSICARHPPPVNALSVAASCNLTVCSRLRRSVESASVLGKNAQMEDLFHEMEIPCASFPSPALSPHVWAVIFRIGWFLGFSRHCETYSAAQRRAKNAAQTLQLLAGQYQSVLFVGHGMLNRYIAQELLATGWSGAKNPGKKYWEFAVYERAI